METYLEKNYTKYLHNSNYFSN